MRYFKVVKKVSVEKMLWYRGSRSSGGISFVCRVARRGGALRKDRWGTYVEGILVDLL